MIGKNKRRIAITISKDVDDFISSLRRCGFRDKITGAYNVPKTKSTVIDTILRSYMNVVKKNDS